MVTHPRLAVQLFGFLSSRFYAQRCSRGQNNVKGGFFLTEDLARFDAPFFGLTKAEAASLDPERRLPLECAYETLENAGTKLKDTLGSEMGVYVGIFMSDWGKMTRRDPDALTIYQLTGSGHSMLAGRMLYSYNLRGPSMTVNTACSASFVALHSACSALHSGGCTSALVGGVNSLLNHDLMEVPTQLRPWKSANVLRASINNFGYAGTNAHVIVERAKGYLRQGGLDIVAPGSNGGRHHPNGTTSVIDGTDANESSRFHSYDVTDTTTGFFEKLKQKAADPWSGLVNFGKLNIEQDPGTTKSLKDDGRPAIIVAELSGSLLKNLTEAELKMVQHVLMGRDQVLWVTQGAAFSSTNPDLNLVSGLFATLGAELGGLLVHFDLDSSRALDHQAPCAQQWGSWSETQPFFQPGRALKLKMKTPGLLDSLYFDDDKGMSTPPRGDEVDIKVMGHIETYDLGAEFSGIIARVGPDVKSLRVGDHVVQQAFGTFSTFAQTREIFTTIFPDVTMEEATTLPIVLTIAVYAVKVARLSAGDTVLVRCAAGGLGQALVVLCKIRGANVYITVGTVAKKEFMMGEYGIREDRIFTSRDGSFQKGVLQATGGVGVNVIFNLLSSDLLRATWECIAPFGRFTELGKRNFAFNSRLDMTKFARNVTFAAVDRAGVIQERPEEAAAAQREAMSMLMDGAVHTRRPVSVYSMENLETALRRMQTGRHMGKFMVRPTVDDVVRVLPRRQERASFLPNASYLLIGGLDGLGGIGHAWAKRTIHLGAKHLIFMSPSGAQKPQAKAALEEMQRNLEAAHVLTCGVSDRDQLAAALGQTTSLPLIRGVFQCASNFASSLFRNTSLEVCMATLRPKVQSTWNLHEILPHDSLDCFVLLSSATSIVGNTSQSAHSAAPTFQGAFSDHHNNTLGLPAVSIDPDMVAGVDHVAEHADVWRSLQGQGHAEISEEECMSTIEAAMMQPSRAGESGNVIISLDDPFGGYSPMNKSATMSLVRLLAARTTASRYADAEASSDGVNSTPRVCDLPKKAATVEEVERHVADSLLAKMCSLLMVSTNDIDMENSMSHYGLDSHIAVVSLSSPSVFKVA
ncbi:hypothetical protein GMORB2_3137 [Geosmithia morbida]|uniref:Ketosynthase family 3 (KS3) domain-containing protein n=1 Tax=Geosmithia morbida TaxID=1094350 RepID=A0A9P4YNR3_9HYPO|nr:uncharacterized protein GMORB2_3137 [Geosmithia morbida]KAF4120336.1 hypothetical protein GMORB2_3137 [Geosmithia morbida]